MTEEVLFYGADGKLMGTYSVHEYGNYEMWFTRESAQVYFAGKLVGRWTGLYNREAPIVTDRSGSVVSRGANRRGYYPYGEEKPVTADENQFKFATYYRDKLTGLDYAKNRYYSSRAGRFLTPDPYGASGGPADPQSWNRYTYVEGDPVNFFDPAGS